MKYFKYAEISYKNVVYLVFLVPKSVIQKLRDKITILCFDFERYSHKESREGTIIAVWLDKYNKVKSIDCNNKTYGFIPELNDYDKLKTLAKNTMWIDSLLLK